jgi:hypothetical protein
MLARQALCLQGILNLGTVDIFILETVMDMVGC